MTDPIGPLLAALPPALDDAEMRALAILHHGLSGETRRLTSERDLNLRLQADDGQVYVLKVSNAAEDAAVTRFQTRALQHVAARAPDLPVPRVIPAQDGRALVPLAQGGHFRVLSYLEGLPMHMAPPTAAQRKAVGAALAALDRALCGLEDPAADHVLLWDLQQAHRLAPLIQGIPEPDLRARAARALDDFAGRVAPALNRMPRQVIHADLNPHNLLVHHGNPDAVAGVLDFGDMVRAPRICDVAVAAAYQMRPEAPQHSLCDFVAGYHAVSPLQPAELDLLPDLIALRMVATLAITGWRAARQPENAPYILRNARSARDGLRALAGVPPEDMRAAMGAVCAERESDLA